MMKPAIKLLGIIVIVAVIGFSITSCENALMSSSYMMELYTISASTYNYLHTGSHYVNEAVDYAKKQSGTVKINSGSGDSIDDVRTWLANYFYSSDINDFISKLEQSGEYAAIFPAGSSSSCGLVYVKEN